MPPRKRTGRAAAQAAYADLMKEHTALVGDVGEAYNAYVAKLEAAAAERERYEQARAAAIKAGAVTNDQLDQMGYKKTSKLPTPAAKTPTETPNTAAAQPRSQTGPRTDGAAPAPALASGGGRDGEG